VVSGRTVLAVRLDSAGDVLVTGPAIRALASAGDDVVVLAGPQGTEAAGLLPGVREVVSWSCPWIVADPTPVDDVAWSALIEDIRERDFDEAVIFTSFHQSALPTALALRLAGVPKITAISEDYPGSLLDVRVPPPGDIPEPERALAVARAAGFDLPDGDNGHLALRPDLLEGTVVLDALEYVVAHPGTTAPARAWPEHRWCETVAELSDHGHTVVVTGGPGERELCARLSAHGGVDLSGSTTMAELAAIMRGAKAVIAANTGPAHLAAAVGTPVVSLFAPVVPAERWAPYGVPTVVLGDQTAPCRGTRARECPVPGHPCLSTITSEEVIAAVDHLTAPSQQLSMRNGGSIA
jgi:ADP-heptose:LPS heptosyltransferase